MQILLEIAAGDENRIVYRDGSGRLGVLRKPGVIPLAEMRRQLERSVAVPPPPVRKSAGRPRPLRAANPVKIKPGAVSR